MSQSSLRIVSLLSSATEMLGLLDLADQLVAISHECDYPPQMLGKPRATKSNVDSLRSSLEIDAQVKTLLSTGRPLYEIDRELVTQLNPDLIVTQAQCDVCAVKYADVIEFVYASPTLLHTQVLALNPMCLADVFADLERLGLATQRLALAHQVVAGFRQRVAAIRSRTEQLAPHERPRVVCIEWIEPLMIAANWTPQLLEWAGGQPGLAVAGEHSRYVDWQEMAAFDPEVVVVAPCGFDLPRTLQEAELLRQQPVWEKLSAVRHGLVFSIDGNAYLNRSGPRLVETLELLAHLLQPQLFPINPCSFQN